MGNTFDRDLSHLHPRLAALVPLIQATYAARHPGFRLMVAETRRSVQEQAKRFAEGSTKCDGMKSYSLHNYPISYAVDLWVEAGKQSPWRVTWAEYAYRQLVAVVYDLIKQGHPIASGLDWDRDGVPGTIDPDERRLLRDGPHVQLTSYVLHADLQRALTKAGHALVDDGAWGPKSQAAAKAYLGTDDGRASPALYQRLLDAGCVEVG